MPAPDNVVISERFTKQCSPVISTNYDTCGTVTRATVAHLTPADLDAIFSPGGLFADLDAWFKHSIEMKACGVRVNTMYDWIMANADRTEYRGAISGTKGVKTESLLHPFILGSQETVLNPAYWKITAGAAGSVGIGVNPSTVGSLSDQGNSFLSRAAVGSAVNPDAIMQEDGSTVYAYDTTGVRWIRITNRFGIPVDDATFNPRNTIHIFTQSSTGVAQHGQWKILGSKAGTTTDGNTAIDIALANENAGSPEPYDQTPSSTLKGVVIAGINNVDDYEKWCHNRTTLDPRKRVLFWVQTRRNSRCVDAEYMAVFKRLLLTNPAFKEFGDLDMAERNRQDEASDQREFVHSFFFNKAISAKQTQSLWQTLEPIYTTEGAGVKLGLGSKLVGRRSNFVGVKEQLRECGRVYDLMNQTLRIEEWLDLNYNLKRARETGLNGKRVTDIDWWTNSQFRALFQQAYVEYAAAKWGAQARWDFEYNKVSEAGILFDSYTFQYPSGIRINLLSNDFFDDFLDQFVDQSITARGNLLLALDIGKPGPNGGSIFYSQLGANRATYQSADLAQLARIDSTMRCVLKQTSVEQTLMSETGTVIVSCPLQSAWIEGVSLVKPIATGKLAGPSYLDLY